MVFRFNPSDNQGALLFESNETLPNADGGRVYLDISGNASNGSLVSLGPDTQSAVTAWNALLGTTMSARDAAFFDIVQNNGIQISIEMNDSSATAIAATISGSFLANAAFDYTLLNEIRTIVRDMGNDTLLGIRPGTHLGNE